MVVFNEGQITGSDRVLAYTGTYFQTGDDFSASITTRRYAPGQSSVFEIDEVDLTLTGKSTPTTASCTGSVKQAPGVTFGATLIRIAD